MAYPNILTYKGDGVLQYISNTQLTAISELVLERLSTANSFGNIYVNDSGGGSYTSLDVLEDIYRTAAVGGSGAATTTDSDTIYQDETGTGISSVTEIPVEWDSGTNILGALGSTGLDQLADEILSYLVTNDGPTTFKIATAAPVDGGTWVSMATLDDLIATGTTGAATVYLFKKIAGSTTVTDLPVKVDGPGRLKTMTSAEVEELAFRVQQRIVDTGIGQYAITTTGSPPVTGTWENMGAFTDNLANTVETGFVGVTATPSPPYYGPAGGVPKSVIFYLFYFGPTSPPPYEGNIPGFGFFYRIAAYYGVTFTPATYTGTVVDSAYTLQTTYTLWRRIA